MSRQLLNALFKDSPCFAQTTFGIQGDPVRHVFMSGAINVLSGWVDGPIRMLEVGSWTGSSVLTWAQAIDRFCPHKGSILCVDYWDTFVTKEDLDSQQSDLYQTTHSLTQMGIPYDLFLHNIQFAKSSVKVNHFRGKSCEVLPYLGNEQFDMIYIDGSHYLDDVRGDLEQAIRMLKTGGILCGDDLELQLFQCDEEFARSQLALDWVKDPKAKQFFHPGVTIAVDEVIGRVSNYAGFWLVRKTDEGFEPISLEDADMLLPEHFPAEMNDNILKRLKPSPSNRTA